MSPPDYAQLGSEYAAGAPSEEGSGRNRRLTFDDGTVWFPEGCELTKNNPALPFLGGLVAVCLIGTIVGIADGASFAWVFAGALVLTVVALARVIRRLNAAEDAARGGLRVGLFLGDGALVIRRDGEDEVLPRDRIQQFVIKNRVRGGSRSLPWIHVIVDRGGVKHDVPTDLTRPALDTLQRWLDEERTPP